MKEKEIHDGHRKRMRERYLQTGLTGFQPHEILEMLLFYAIPRKNTNPIAHALLREFGTLDQVLAADPKMLRKIPGMTDTAAVMLPFLRDLFCLELSETQTGVLMDSGKQAGSFFRKLYRFERKETVHLALLDDRLILKKCVQIADGHPSAAEFMLRTVTETAFAESCNLLILAHNHPNSIPKPSAADISTTRILAEALKKNGISLMYHIIVGRGEYCSMRECGAFLGIS